VQPSVVQVDLIAEDAQHAIVEASMPRGMWEIAVPADLCEELRAAVQRHLVRLTQDWADQVAAVVEQITG
jgi:hypothetical protein